MGLPSSGILHRGQIQTCSPLSSVAIPTVSVTTVLAIPSPSSESESDIPPIWRPGESGGDARLGVRGGGEGEYCRRAGGGKGEYCRRGGEGEGEYCRRGGEGEYCRRGGEGDFLGGLFNQDLVISTGDLLLEVRKLGDREREGERRGDEAGLSSVGMFVGDQPAGEPAGDH